MMDMVFLKQNEPCYPLRLQTRLGNDTPKTVTASGNLGLLQNKLIALFCSVKCPGDLILQTYDLAQLARQVNITFIGGFQSPIEREFLSIYLRGSQPFIICPARSLEKMRMKAEYKKPFKEERILFLSPFKVNRRRPTVQMSMQRNLFVAALADSILIAHAQPDSRTEELCRKIIPWQKPIFTLDSDYNKNLINLGAQPVKPAELTCCDYIAAKTRE